MNITANDAQLTNLIHNIITLRQRHGLSQRQMAAILHISPYMLRMLEKGQISRRLYVDFLFHLRSYFHITFNDLFYTQL